MDGEYSDNRRPDSVEFSSIEEDAKRRDFTINGLFYDPIEGKVLDFVDGEKDIAVGIVRFIGDAEARISEDKLRLLRGVRFALRFGFELEKASYEAIKRNAEQVTLVSKERIRDELIKMVKIGKPRKMLELLFDTGLIRYVLPDIEKLRGVEQDPIWHPEGAMVREIIYEEEK
jgi:poly(A) polymerase